MCNGSWRECAVRAEACGTGQAGELLWVGTFLRMQQVRAPASCLASCPLSCARDILCYEGRNRAPIVDMKVPVRDNSSLSYSLLSSCYLRQPSLLLAAAPLCPPLMLDWALHVRTCPASTHSIASIIHASKSWKAITAPQMTIVAAAFSVAFPL